LEIIADEDEERHKEAHKRAWKTQLELYDGKRKKGVAKRHLKRNGKMCNIVVKPQGNTILQVEKLQKGVQDMQRILKKYIVKDVLKN
jgi:hypothetical protein